MGATATLKRGVVTDSLVSLYGEVFNVNDGFLRTYNIERDEQIELLGLSLVAGLDPLFLGDPGVGKTWMIELLMRCIDTGGDPNALFTTLVFKETPADDILGPRSLPAMKAGKIERLTDGYLPTSVVAYVDEFFKASPTLANSLLDIMANRVLKVGNQVIDCHQLLCMYASSNELPDREDLQPVRDRFGITNFVPAVKSPEGRKSVMRIQDEYQANARAVDLSGAPTLTLDQVREMRAEVRRVVLPESVIESMVTAQERWAQKGFAPSQRRIGQMLMAIKARAWARGDGTASTDDMIVAAHMAWNHPDHAKDAREVVMEFANQFARKALRMREALEPLTTEVEEIRKRLAEGASADDEMEAGFKVMRGLRTMKREAKENIEKGKAQGHDTRDLENVADEIDRAHSWLQSTLAGEDDDS
jgi:MoxR-like ATPase